MGEVVEAQTYAQKAARRDAEPLGKDRLVTEADDLLLRFMDELAKPTGDGQQKRKVGKPPWYIDPGHADAFYRHLKRWEEGGEIIDRDSGAHTLVHAAWRLLAIACKETGNVPTVLTAEQQVL